MKKKIDHKNILIAALIVAVIGLTAFILFDKKDKELKIIGTQMMSPSVGGCYIATQYEEEQVIKTPLIDANGEYCPIQVEAGKPVKWIIVANEGEITGCNGEILINEYGIDIEIIPGENLIEFTPKEDGSVEYTCGMDMMRSEIVICNLGTDYQRPEY